VVILSFQEGENLWYPPIPKRGQGVLSDIYP
jgi:hypothetical protein